MLSLLLSRACETCTLTALKCLQVALLLSQLKATGGGAYVLNTADDRCNTSAKTPMLTTLGKSKVRTLTKYSKHMDEKKRLNIEENMTKILRVFPTLFKHRRDMI